MEVHHLKDNLTPLPEISGLELRHDIYQGKILELIFNNFIRISVFINNGL